MDPWRILGWLKLVVISLVGLGLLAALVAIGWQWLYWYRLHRRTRDIAPQVGQVWIEPPGKQLEIIRADRDGHVTVTSRRLDSTLTWGMGRHTWKHFVRANRIYLERGPGL